MAIDLRDVPKEKQNYDMCLASVSADWRQLEYVVPALRTENLCLKAIKESGLAIKYVPHQTPEMCRAAIRQNPYALEYIQERTPELCLEAIKRWGGALQFVKEQTPEICLAAAEQNGYALKYVKNQTPEICLAAVREWGNALQYVKDQTPEICLEAVKQNGMVLQYIPKREQTLHVVIAALRQNPDSRKFLAAKFRTPEVYKAAGYNYQYADLASSHSRTKRERTEERH